ncbi:unnamed protein product [Symbiodinium natans]|uniref:Uncharacterized protein n=1 Tax=Symbiodinium natans TaxID=878477 RepID=A0A812LE68_9DINO|nr:unnamed protein product [Symbiodinium natans]
MPEARCPSKPKMTMPDKSAMVFVGLVELRERIQGLKCCCRFQAWSLGFRFETLWICQGSFIDQGVLNTFPQAPPSASGAAPPEHLAPRQPAAFEHAPQPAAGATFAPQPTTADTPQDYAQPPKVPATPVSSWYQLLCGCCGAARR